MQYIYVGQHLEYTFWYIIYLLLFHYSVNEIMQLKKYIRSYMYTKNAITLVVLHITVKIFENVRGEREVYNI